MVVTKGAERKDVLLVSASEVKNKIGLVLERALRGRSTQITRYGRVIAVVQPSEDEREAA